MTIHFFTKGDRSVGSSRQRAFLVANELNKRGVAAIVHTPSVDDISRMKRVVKLKQLWNLYGTLLKNIQKGDVIYIQRAVYDKYFSLFILLYVFFRKEKMIFDIDDAIYLHSPRKVRLFARFADAVIVGSHALESWAKKYNKNIFVIPTSVNSAEYELFTKAYKGKLEKLHVGWVGGGIDQFENLKLLAPVFQILATNGVPVKFTLIGALGYKPLYELFGAIAGLETEFVDSLNWSNSEEVRSRIQAFDVGVMPLTNTEWNRGKCSFKAIEYMAAGVVPIVSNVGENVYLVDDGKNGFLADSALEWVIKLTQLFNEPDSMRVIGKKAQQTIHEHYSFESNIPKLINIIEQL